MKILDRQQFGLALGEPPARGGALALWAVAVATTNGELTITCLMGKIGNGESARACHLLDRLFHVFHRGYAYVLLPISQMFTGGRPTVIWSPIAKSQGAQCWRDILRHQKCSATYSQDRADNILMGLLRRSTQTDTVMRPPYATFGRPLTSAMSSVRKAVA